MIQDCLRCGYRQIDGDLFAILWSSDGSELRRKEVSRESVPLLKALLSGRSLFKAGSEVQGSRLEFSHHP